MESEYCPSLLCMHLFYINTFFRLYVVDKELIKKQSYLCSVSRWGHSSGQCGPCGGPQPEGNCMMATLRSVSLTGQSSKIEEKRNDPGQLEIWQEDTNSLGEKTVTYPVSASWTWHGSEKGDNLDPSWSKGWVWGPTPLMLAAYRGLWPPPWLVCGCSRDSAFLASSSVATPRRINIATADECAVALE